MRFLKKSIDSILDQTYKDFEFLILDDGSTEPVWELLTSYKDPRIVLLRNEKNIGLTKSLNICLDHARGDFIARQDSDDISYPYRFAYQMRTFRADTDLIFSHGVAINEAGDRIDDDWMDRIVRRTTDHESYLRTTGNCLIATSAVFRRRVFEHIGYFDRMVRYAQDYNYWLRSILGGCKMKVIERVLVAKRTHPNMIWSDPFRLREWVDVARERAVSNPIIPPDPPTMLL